MSDFVYLASQSPRRRQLLDAALHVVADQGLRGLTHRAVDREAGLPEGSCCAYLRTRKALQGALTEYVAGSLAADCHRLAVDVQGCPGDVDRAIELTMRLFERWVEERELLLAKLELSMEASRDPELAELLAGYRSRLVDVVDGLGLGILHAHAGVGCGGGGRRGRRLGGRGRRERERGRAQRTEGGRGERAGEVGHASDLHRMGDGPGDGARRGDDGSYARAGRVVPGPARVPKDTPAPPAGVHGRPPQIGSFDPRAGAAAMRDWCRAAPTSGENAAWLCT